ncbi:MAG: RlmE family RNA methyltransferase [Alphaproteobacteria bacterium]|nr:RlmE family RNA methyltransferase [Alphaproteobacteria bacterium]
MTRGRKGSGPGRGGSARPPARALKERVRTARGRSVSSTAWLARQINDPYVKAAKADGYRSRAAYKLLQIDEQAQVLRPGALVVDLGAAPGGWTQVALARGARVIAVDVSPMDPLPGAVVLELDFLAADAPERVRAAAGGPVSAVLSDMAAPATGHRQTDHLRIMALCEAAAAFADEVLEPGGTFVAKVLQGGTEATLLANLKRHFQAVRHYKPPASRKDSSEIYVIATGFRKL